MIRCSCFCLSLTVISWFYFLNTIAMFSFHNVILWWFWNDAQNLIFYEISILNMHMFSISVSEDKSPPIIFSQFKVNGYTFRATNSFTVIFAYLLSTDYLFKERTCWSRSKLFKSRPQYKWVDSKMKGFCHPAKQIESYKFVSHRKMMDKKVDVYPYT